MAAAIPNAKLVEIQGAGHEMVWTHADEVAGELIAFLD
jgi:pimeloyl-ACP methyl ester carboxylesterase